MSRLEERSKQIFVRIFNGGALDLSPEESLLLARWADKTAMAQEVGDRVNIVSTIAQRKAFMLSEWPERFSEVYIGTFDDATGPLRRRHYRYTDGADPHPRLTARCTSFVIGPVVIVVWGYSIARPSSFIYLVEGTEMQPYLKRIWPQTGVGISWPLKPMNYRQYFFLTELYLWEVELGRLRNTAPPSLMSPAEWAAIPRDEVLRLVPGVGLV